MAISKRVRYEILRRDDFACQYCGQLAPDVILHVDHVIPIALGGSDDPGNLVTACKDCNAGKTSVQPDAPLVAQVSALSAAYALEIVDKLTRIRARLTDENEYIYEVEQCWNGWKAGEKTLPLPLDWKTGVRRWRTMGVPFELIEYGIDVAMRATKVDMADKFRYAGGVIWRTLDNEEASYPLTPETVKVYTESEADEERVSAYEQGLDNGIAIVNNGAYRRDHLALLIDGVPDPLAATG